MKQSGWGYRAAVGFGVIVFSTAAWTAKPSAKTPLLLEVPVLRQTTEYSCGAASLASALGYYGTERSEPELMKELGTTPHAGTEITEMAKSARLHGVKATVRDKLSLEDLRKHVRRRQLAIICMQAWSETPGVDYTDRWNDGHYVVLIGIDASRIYFMDPAILGGHGFLPLAEFEKRWHDVDFGGKELHQAALLLDGTPKPPPLWQLIE